MGASAGKKGLLLVIGLIVMLFNSIYQYSWNALGPLIERGLPAGFEEVQVAFTLFVIFSVVFQLIGGAWADRQGPTLVSMVAAILSAVGFLGTAASHSLFEFYAVWSAGSAGEGILYGIASNIAIKWFSERRGLAIGLISLGFGAGGSIANPFIISIGNFREASLYIGIIEIAVLLLLASRITYPTGLKGRSTVEVIRGPSWWLFYASYAFAAVPLLAFSSALTALAAQVGSERFWLELAITLFPLMSGAGRPVLGAARDKLGSINTIIIIIIMMLVASVMLYPFKQLFPAAVVVGIFGGALVPIYFSAVGDMYGEAFSTSNTALLYTGKMISGVLGGSVFAFFVIHGAEASTAFMVVCEALALIMLFASIRLRGKEERAPP